MSRPIRKQSHDAATAAGAGEVHKSKAHNSVGLFVVAQNLDSANDTLTVQVEGSPTGSNGEWATIDTKQGGTKTQRLTVDISDMEDTDGDGTYVGFVYAHGIPVEWLRVNVTTFTDAANGDLTVDTYITGVGNAGTGHGFDT